jgi:hypothetical protein
VKLRRVGCRIDPLTDQQRSKLELSSHLWQRSWAEFVAAFGVIATTSIPLARSRRAMRAL